MTEEEVGLSRPGPSYARALADGIAFRCNPRRFTPEEISAARREANNLARLIEWAVLPLVANKDTGERLAFQSIANRLARFGIEEELHADYPESVDQTPLLLANFDELARRVEAALAPLAKKGGRR
jgi:hypothetical protein